VSAFGCDFTCDESKPNIIAEVVGEALVTFHYTRGLTAFAEKLGTLEGSIGIDAPFGYPTAFIEATELGMNWDEMAAQIARLGPRAMRIKAKWYRDARPAGQKEPKRLTDTLCHSQSAMKFHMVPVGLMAAKLIPILGASNTSLWPVRETNSRLVAFEVYPALTARHHGLAHYKSSQATSDTRYQLLEKLEVDIPTRLVDLIIGEPTADHLDSVIAALEGRWAKAQLEAGLLKQSKDTDPREGWIINRYL
jgi:hypothetical protein